MDSQHYDVLEANDNVVSNQNDVSSNKLDTVTDMNLENKPIEILRNSENVSYIYRQDVVRRKSDSEIGVVIQVHGDSDSDSSVSDSEDENEGGDEIVDSIGFDYDNRNEENNGYSGENVRANSDENESSPTVLTANHVRVLLMDGSEVIEAVNNVDVVDRGFLHGDYVGAASDPTGQVGIVVDVNIDVDLLTHKGCVLKDKSSRDLKRIKDFTVGDYVVLGPWLGRVDDVFDNVTVQFDDGSICKVMRADPFHLIPIGNNINEDGRFPYYPGQRVKASSSSVLKNSRWLTGLWKANKVEGTVTKVTVGSVWIYWIASAGYRVDSATAPSEEQSPKNLKLLSCFAHTNWQLGYWCLLPPLECSASFGEGLVKQESSHYVVDEPESTEIGDKSDSELAIMDETDEQTGHTNFLGRILEACSSKNGEETSKNSVSKEMLSSTSGQATKGSIRELGPFNRKKIRKVGARKEKKGRKKLETFERALQIINIRTKVDVVWQDGKIDRGLASSSLVPIESPGDHDFVAEQYVVEKAADSDDTVDSKRVGVVRSVNANDRTACVRWLKQVSKADDPKEFDKEEMVSVYELEGHPDYDYCYGDVVVRLSPVLLPAQMSSFEPSAENAPLSSSDDPENEESKHHVLDNTDYSPAHEFSDLSWFGNITWLRDGDIEITWADGMISTVGPQAIYVVDRDDDESMTSGSDVSDDAASWETVEDDRNNVDEEANQIDNDGYTMPENEDSNIFSEHSGKNRALAIPMTAIGFVTRLASRIFSRGGNHLDPLNIGIKSDDDFHPDEMPLNRSPDGDACSENPVDAESKSSITTTCTDEGRNLSQSSDILEMAEALCNLKTFESAASSRRDSVLKFKDFDIARDPSDHHFVSSYGQKNASRKWLKKVQQDWDILQKNLPGDIYVRAFEDRMDLLRAVIVGAYGTPYQDGLFFFDFHLPPEYPDVPPSAYYHSGGWRINPNLYEEGKVCLSLLNTWTGRGNEVWDPSTSSILQVLVSLQGLVLNSKPYFNEAGYDKQVGTAEGEKNALTYNENTFLLNCKTMMYLMRKPPTNFEELIIEHFRMRGPCILRTCDAYMKGHMIGSLAKDAFVHDSSNTNANSLGFRQTLRKLLPKLLSSLSEVGADCQEFEHLATDQL